MTREKKKMRKNHKKITPKGKKITTGAASVLLGAGIMVGANARPVKAASSREDEITEVENANVLAGEKTEITVEQKSTDAVQDTQVEQNTDPEVQTEQNTVENVQVTQETTPVEEVQSTPQSDNAVQDTVQNDSESATAAQVNTEVQNAEQTVALTENNEQMSDAGGVVGAPKTATGTETTPVAKEAIEDNSATITPDDATKGTEDKVERTNEDELIRLQQAIEQIAADYAKDIVVNDPSITHVDGKSNLDELIKNLKSYNDEQITNISNAIDKYKADMEAYTKEKTAYDAFLAELEKYGLYKTGDTDPATLNQGLKFGEEQNAKVDVKIENDSTVTTQVWNGWRYVDRVVPAIEDGSDVRDKGRDFLNYFYRIRTEATQLDGPLLTLTYTGLENTSYGNTKIDKMVITFSDWKYNSNYGNNQNSEPGIYFSNDPTKGFWYIKSDGVTMEMQLYSGDKVVTLGDDAYVVTGSMNSEGGSSKYIEKAQIINNGQEYGGNGISLPESEVTVHKDPNGGGDILYSEKNINFFDDLSNDNQTVDELKKTAEGIWGKEGGDFRIDNYLGWDATPEELANLSEEDQAKYSARKIYGTGLFKVYGDRIKIRFSNEIGSGWSTYSSDIPSLTKAEPEKPELSYTPGKLVLDQSAVTIHYMDVNGMNEADIQKGSGTELKYQNFGDLIVDGHYSITNLWNWENGHYKLVKMDQLDNIAIFSDHMDLYIYLKHETKNIYRDKVINQVIHYQTDKGETLKEDYTAQLTFTQTGKKDLVDNVDIWDGEWTPTQIFVEVESPEIIDHYHLSDPQNDSVVKAIPKIVTNENVGADLNEERTIKYTDNVISEAKRYKVITQTIHYVAEDGTDLGYPDYTATLTFKQTGQYDSYTKKYIWDGEWTPTQIFVEVESPEVIGRYHLKDKDNDSVVKAIEKTVTNENVDTIPDEVRTIVYVANVMTDTSRDKVINQVIHYQTEDGTELQKDYTASLKFTQTGKHDTYTNEDIWDGEWTPTQTFVEVESPEVIGHYHLKDKDNDSVVKAISKTVTNENVDADLNENRTIYYIPNVMENTSRIKDILQTIHYVAEDGTNLGYDDYTATLTFEQKGQYDTYTKEFIWDGEWTPTQDFVAVENPEVIKHYHLKDKDNDSVVKKIEKTVTNENVDTDLNEERTILYVANDMEEVTRTQTVEQVIHYVAEDGTELGYDDYTAVISFTQHGQKDLYTGEYIWDENWSQVLTFDAVESPEVIDHYHLKDKEKDSVVGPIQVPVTVADFANKGKNEYTVYYVANAMEETTRTKVVEQLIHYVYEDGTKAAEDHVVKLIFTQTGKKDLVTGEETWDSEWTETKTFETVVSPIIDGYTADKKEIEAYNVTVNNGNFDEKQDEEFTVTYTKNPVTPGPDDPTPGNPDPVIPDPDNPTPDTPTPDPTPGDDEEIATPPLPEDEIGNYPSQSDEDDEEKHTAPHATGKETRSGTNKNNARVISLENAVSDDSVTPENVSTEATDKTDEKPTTVNSTNEKTLPATGEEKDDFAKVMSGLAAALGITGLAVTSKRRKATAKRSKKDKKNGK